MLQIAWIKKVQLRANLKRMLNELNHFLPLIKDNTTLYERSIDFKVQLELELKKNNQK